MGGLESALGRPARLVDHGEPDIADRAALGAVGIAKSHAFADGIKRMDGCGLEGELIAVVGLVLRIAEGKTEPGAVAGWLRPRLRRMAPGICGQGD